MNVIDYITITCNLKKMVDYRLHPITWKNVIDYNWLQLQITITPCLIVICVSLKNYLTQCRVRYFNYFVYIITVTWSFKNKKNFEKFWSYRWPKFFEVFLFLFIFETSSDCDIIIDVVVCKFFSFQSITHKLWDNWPTWNQTAYKYS